MKNIIKEMINDSPVAMISYAEFINAALYHPMLGYYMKDKVKIGKGGDFITTSNISDVFGETISKWYAEQSANHNLPPVVCEIGAGNGRFARAFIDGWRRHSGGSLEYRIVEMSPYHRRLQSEALQGYSNVVQYRSLDELEAFEGLVFSNELFDALPVHVVQKVKGTIMEAMITVQDGHVFTEQLVPVNNGEILRFLQDNKINLAEGQRMEIPLAMEPTVKQMARVLTRGLVLTVDYGYFSEEWMEPARRKGSLRGYHNHAMINNILEQPGEADITSHVHFDALLRQGEAHGLRCIDILRQDEFLLKNGILEELAENYDPNPFSATSKRNRAIRSLIIPGGMSAAFHVIVQGKSAHIVK
ncbi:class I SAM-dependent methyltransferase [Bacillus sp. T33-2]|uniref:class I SAM-dependent methyltransferase n=1 Tax=Bacillus sp. T33-2 TaxID=2054168 RepID=UPI000C788999|nr:SAM-dependent methyltransferase [Bacillus sp. T33-2]PLR89502.1 SAM-dependent methyltransferase [Bacillus sp. T33-2]